MSVLDDGNVIAPLKLCWPDATKFVREHVCSICRQHPHYKPASVRDLWEIHCLNCNQPIIEGGYISAYDLQAQESDEQDTRRLLQGKRNVSADDILKELGF